MSHADFPGQRLRERREERGLSMQDVYAHVHVPIVHLQALEEGRLEDLPGLTYASGFLVSYCEFLDLDPEPFLDQFRLIAQPAVVRRFRATPRPFDYVPRPQWWGDLVTWGAICAVILLGWLTYSAVIRPFAEVEETRVEAGAVTISTPSPLRRSFSQSARAFRRSAEHERLCAKRL